MLSRCLQICLFGILCWAVVGFGDKTAAADDPMLRKHPLPLDDAMRTFTLADGFQLQVVCHEPQVIDPVSARFDHLGRLWVVEMSDYPTGPEDGKSFSGRIKILRDTNKDGFFETATVFADQLVFPTGVQPFNGGILEDGNQTNVAAGVIVTLAGEICYLADLDGDDVCDFRQTWFSGFSTGNEQLRANHPTWTLENEVHVASGLRGGEVIAADPRWQQRSGKLSLAIRDFQFSPFGGNWQSVAGNSQYGFYQDAAGRRYICSNRNPCDLLLAEPRQVSHNPLLPLSSWTVNVMPAAEQSRVFPLVDAWTTSNLHAGQFTAACGVFRYESNALTDLQGDFFACEPTGSLVQRYQTVGDGIVPQTKPAHEQTEFLASRDPWFRPVDLTDGPDGAMYVVDMHRAVIEHPDWMPNELKGRRDLRWGNSAGRIYKIVADNDRKLANSKFDFELADQRRKVAALGNANGWTRTTARRLIAEEIKRGDAKLYATLLANYLNECFNVDPVAKNRHVSKEWRGAVAALWLLEFSGLLTDEDLFRASTSRDQEVRIQVVRLVAKRLGESKERTGGLHKKIVTTLASDSQPRVRFQWLLEFGSGELGVESAEECAESILKLLHVSETDSEPDRIWIAKGLALVSNDVAKHVVSKLTTKALEDALLLGPLIERLGWSGSVQTLDVLLRATTSPSQSSKSMNLFAQGMLASGKTWNQLERALSATGSERLRSWISWNRNLAADSRLPTEQRVAAVEQLSLDRSNAALELCKSLLEPSAPRIFVAALGVMRDAGDSDVPKQLVQMLASLPPDAATAVVGAFASNAKWTPVIIEALEQGDVPLAMIDATSRGRITRSPNADVARRFKRLVATRGAEGLDAVLVRYRGSLGESPDLDRGRKVFAKNCASCHRIGDEGFAVGPDISDMRTQTPEQILLAIVDPNAAIDANYYRYSVLTTDGQVLEGLLVDSGSDFVTLRQQEGAIRTILRDSIELFRTTGVSMMPEGLHQQIAPNEMRDLIGYLKGWRFDGAGIPRP